MGSSSGEYKHSCLWYIIWKAYHASPMFCANPLERERLTGINIFVLGHGRSESYDLTFETLLLKD
jgi:hypothetical protein